ncbi:hypothetical protein MAPG_03443 [Magnaporthiopsis poae ATCC 64411]|uniref:Uncharacterized protein n=1 Tax=Magnaporthiopsis poae (strain ATCC 64411 / 73-15) TaxID=644358 RepID=A0A0C4DU11_MAGP6|nr:hypothetical protein MAPG_03443 [Magnaporthiopsis poae ATCC 64411]
MPPHRKLQAQRPKNQYHCLVDDAPPASNGPLAPRRRTSPQSSTKFNQGPTSRSRSRTRSQAQPTAPAEDGGETKRPYTDQEIRVLRFSEGIIGAEVRARDIDKTLGNSSGGDETPQQAGEDEDPKASEQTSSEV